MLSVKHFSLVKYFLCLAFFLLLLLLLLLHMYVAFRTSVIMIFIWPFTQVLLCFAVDCVTMSFSIDVASFLKLKGKVLSLHFFET